MPFLPLQRGVLCSRVSTMRTEHRLMQLRSLLWYYTSFNALYINLSTRCLLVYGIDCNHMGLFAPSAASPLEGAPVTLSDQLTCRNWLAVRLQSGSEWKKKQHFEGTADEMSDHSVERDHMKVLTSYCSRPAFLA